MNAHCKIATKLLFSSFFVVFLSGMYSIQTVQTHYFPPSLFDPDDPESNAYDDRHFSSQLSAFKEESFLNYKDFDSSTLKCRMLWLATNGHPICISVLKNKDKFTLHALQHDGHPGTLQKIPSIILDRTIELKEKDTKDIEKMLESANAWTKPIIENTAGIADGDMIIFENAKKEKYNLILRVGNSITNSERPLFQKLMELSGKDVVKQWNDYRKKDPPRSPNTTGKL